MGGCTNAVKFSLVLGILRQAQGTHSNDSTFAELVEALVALLLNLKGLGSVLHILVNTIFNAVPLKILTSVAILITT